MDYSPFNSFVWLIFTGGVVLVFLCVNIYHHIYPNYPQKTDEAEEPLKFSECMTPDKQIIGSSGVNTGGTKKILP